MTTLQRRPRRAVDADDDDTSQQRPRQRQRREEPEPVAPEIDDDDDEEADQTGAQDADVTQGDESTHAQLVKKLVRYVLACEYSRTPIRRDGIRDKVLAAQGRAFKATFEGAQKQLGAVFGMRLVELPARERSTKDEKRKASKSQGKSAPSSVYVLASILPEPYRAPEILAPSKVLSADDEAGYIAIYTMIITLITLNGGEMSDPKLRRYLLRLNADRNAYGGNKTEDVLARMQRHGYIIKNVDKDARQHAGAVDDATSWVVGPRGLVEVQQEGMATIVREVYGREAAADLGDRIKASLRVSQDVVAGDEDDGDVDAARLEVNRDIGG